MNAIYLFLGFWIWLMPVNIQNAPISADETASRMCRCGQEQQLPALAKTYQAASTQEAKNSVKGDIGQAIRKMHVCMNMAEIQQSTRSLPKEQRVQFEDLVQKKLTEQCPEVAKALQLFR